MKRSKRKDKKRKNGRKDDWRFWRKKEKKKEKKKKGLWKEKVIELIKIERKEEEKKFKIENNGSEGISRYGEWYWRRSRGIKWD